jgi:hypothetical protein
MRYRITSSVPALLLALVFVAVAAPLAAQPAEELPALDGSTLTGYTRGDGTIVLDDVSFCRHLLDASLGAERLTYASLLDKSRQQKRARKAAFVAGSDAQALDRCAAALRAFRDEAPAHGDDLVPGWARRAPVVPDALVGLLPDDLVARPLALTDEVVSAARTSGSGDLVSAPFSVTPGPWLAQVEAVGCDTWTGVLRDARDPSRAFELRDTREYLYELGGGHYYWQVSAPDCDWSVDLVPVVLGPDPTPTPEPRAMVPNLIGGEWDAHPGAPNPTWLDAAAAREAVLAAGLVAGTCNTAEGYRADRVFKQEPVAGTLAPYGSPVDIWIARDCDVYAGDRVLE